MRGAFVGVSTISYVSRIWGACIGLSFFFRNYIIISNADLTKHAAAVVEGLASTNHILKNKF